MNQFLIIKQKVIKILVGMSRYWNIADGLIILVEKSNDQNLLNNVLNIIKNERKNVTDKSLLKKIDKQTNILKKLQEKEALDRSEEESDIDKLLDNI